MRLAASRARGPRARLLMAALASLCTLGLLSGCAAPAARSSAGVTQPAPSTSAAPGSAPGGSANPRDLRGPSTARAVTEVIPIAKHTTPRLPVTVTDETGKHVTVRDASRILALDVYGTLAETVVGLGLGDRLIGRGASNTLRSMRALPRVTGNGHALNGEAILSLRPTLLLTDTTVGPREVQDQLRASGVTVVFFSPDRTLAGVSDNVRAVAHALGVDAAGTKLAKRLDRDFAASAQKIRTIARATGSKPLRIAFLYVRGSAGIFFILGKGSGADDLITSIGAIDAATAAGVTGTKPATSEALVAMDPEVILTMTDGLASAGGVAGLLTRPGIAETTAGRHQRIVDMADGQILSFGATAPDVVLSLARAVYEPAPGE